MNNERSVCDHSQQPQISSDIHECAKPGDAPNTNDSSSSIASPLVELCGVCEEVHGMRGDADATHALQLLERVREQLVDALAGEDLPETFAAPLSRNFPIKECTRPGFHGFCDIQKCKWQDDGTGNLRQAQTFTVRSASVQLFDELGQPLPVEWLLATFIHELAHTVTRPEMRRAGAVDIATLKLQPQVVGLGARPDEMVPVHHSDDFYSNFAALLRIADKLQIYSLPVGPNKFAPKSLMRFDSIDPAAIRAGLSMGKSELYATALGAVVRPLRVLLTDCQRIKTKPLELDARDVSLAHVLKEAKRRLNLRKKPTKVCDAAGNPVEQAVLSQLADGALLVVS